MASSSTMRTVGMGSRLRADLVFGRHGCAGSAGKKRSQSGRRAAACLPREWSPDVRPRSWTRWKAPARRRYLFVVTKGLKICSRSSAGTPGPVSSSRTSMPRRPLDSAGGSFHPEVSRPGCPWPHKHFATRFRKTCSQRPSSSGTSGRSSCIIPARLRRAHPSTAPPPTSARDPAMPRSPAETACACSGRAKSRKRLTRALSRFTSLEI